jgi:dephospho-CoA kinase
MLAEDARKRLAAQIPDAEKAPLCDWIIDNSSELAAVEAKVIGIYAELKAASELKL